MDFEEIRGLRGWLVGCLLGLRDFKVIFRNVRREWEHMDFEEIRGLLGWLVGCLLGLRACLAACFQSDFYDFMYSFAWGGRPIFPTC